MMKRTLSLLIPLLLSSLLANAAQAQCYFAYKAKKEHPLQLHYGIIRVEQSCSTPADQTEIARRIAVDGWQLLRVLDPIVATDLNDHKEEAGEFFLRY